MRKVWVLLVLLAAARAGADEGMPQRGFVADLRVGAGVPVSLGGLGVASGFTAIPSLALGGRLLGRLQLTMGFSFLRVESSGGGDISAFHFAPTVAVDVAKSSDQKVALYLKFALPVGAAVTNTTTTFLIGFDIGIGTRYAFHRMFALGFEAGAAGLFFDPANNATGVAAFYGALVGTFYYGS
jgi:hypothetical protein